jgi:hypothetical protein
MSWLLFLDESGHDHRQMPYEVRGGIALQDLQLWPFTRAVQHLEQVAFGCTLSAFHKELKGSTLLDRKRFGFANQSGPMPAEERQKHCRAFLTKGFQKVKPTSSEVGILVMDATEKLADRRFVRQLQGYFTKSNSGRYRTQWIVPTPFFVSSDMAYPVQAADVCIYCVNWAFRLPALGMNEPVRDDIRAEFLDWVRRLQFYGEGHKEGKVFETWGICYVPNPCAPGRA